MLLLIILAPAVLGAAEGDAPDAPPARSRLTSWIPAEAPVPGIVRDGMLSVTAGARKVSGEAWAGLPLVFQFGIDWTMGPPAWPLRPIVGYRHASGSGEYTGAGRYALDLAQLGSFTEPIDRGVLSGEFQEIALGAAHGWAWGRLRADLAGGASWTRAALEDEPSRTVLRRLARVDTDSFTDADDGFGWWASAGARVAVGDALLGAELRYTDARLRVFGQDLQAGGWQIGGTVAWTW